MRCSLIQVGDQPGVRLHSLRDGGVPLHADRAQANSRQYGAQGGLVIQSCSSDIIANYLHN